MSDDNKKFLVVNAFADGPFGGNPAAIFTHANGLDVDTMQALARQLNLVETVFVLPADGEADFRLRYFTPHGEIPVAGHPTIAAWLALIYKQIVDPQQKTNFLQVNQAGIQEIKIDNSDSAKPLVIMQQPLAKYLNGICSRAEVAEVFCISENDIDSDLPLQAVDTGLGHLIVPLRSLDALFRVKRQIEPLRSLCKSLNVREAQLFCFETLSTSHHLHTRNMCPREGIEDPACGVGSGAIAAYLSKFCWPEKRDISLKMEQGFVVNMPSIIQTQSEVKLLASRPEQGYDSGAIEQTIVSVGGSGVVMVEGMFLI